MQASGCQQSPQGGSMCLDGAAAVPGLMHGLRPKPPDAPTRPPPISTWSGAYTLDVAPCTQGESSHKVQTGLTILQQHIEFEQVGGPSDQQLAKTAAAWRKPGLPRLAATQSLAPTAKYLAPISCCYMPEPMAVPATAQQEDAFLTSCSTPWNSESSHTRLEVSLHPDQTSTLLNLHHNDQCRHLVASDNLPTQRHPLGVAACRPVRSAAELLTRLKICHTSDSGSTASEGGKYAQQQEGSNVVCPDSLKACRTIGQVAPQILRGTQIPPVTHKKLGTASSLTQGTSRCGCPGLKLTEACLVPTASSVTPTCSHQL